MKKISLAVLMSVIILCVAGCNSQQETGLINDNALIDAEQNCVSDVPAYNVLEVSQEYDVTTVGNHSKEYELNITSDKVDRLLENNTKKINMCGKERSLQYGSTKTSDYNLDDVVIYQRFEEDGTKCLVGLSENTGEIVRWSLFDSSVVDRSRVYTKEECEQISVDLLKTLVDDPDNYYMTWNRSLNFGEYGTTYWFDYYRKIDGVKAMDCVSMLISEYGVCHDYSITGKGMFAHVDTLPANYDKAKIDEAVNEKLDDIYSSAKQNYSVSYKYADETLIIMKDGKLGLLINVKVIMEPLDPEDNRSISGEIASFVVCLE